MELDDDGQPVVTLKRGFMRSVPEIEIEVEFERSDAMDALERARDRANDVNKHHDAMHRMAYAEKVKDELAEIRAPLERLETEPKTTEDE